MMTTDYAGKSQVDLVSNWTQATCQLHTQGHLKPKKQSDDDRLCWKTQVDLVSSCMDSSDLSTTHTGPPQAEKQIDDDGLR